MTPMQHANTLAAKDLTTLKRVVLCRATTPYKQMVRIQWESLAGLQTRDFRSIMDAGLYALDMGIHSFTVCVVHS